MNPLYLALNEYIAIRRSLGFQLREVAGCWRTLSLFLSPRGTVRRKRNAASIGQRTSCPHLHYALRPSEYGLTAKPVADTVADKPV